MNWLFFSLEQIAQQSLEYMLMFKANQTWTLVDSLQYTKVDGP